VVTLNPDGSPQVSIVWVGRVRFPPMDNPPPGYITHITVDRISGVGLWVAQA